MSAISWLCIGDAGIDRYPNQDFPGGISLNHLYHLKNFKEHDLSFYGPLSSTSEGNVILKELKNLNVKIINQEQSYSSLGPPKQEISLQSNGEKVFENYNGEIFKDFCYQSIDEEFDVILAPVFEQNLDLIKDLLNDRPNGDLIFDILDGKDLDYDLRFFKAHAGKVSLIVVGCGEENSHFYNQLKKSAGDNPWRLLVTRGKKPGFYFDGIRFWEFSPTVTSNVVDTTGAGDAFLSAFLYKLYRDVSPHECLKFADLHAQKTLSQIGPH